MEELFERKSIIDLINKTLELNISNCMFMKVVYENDKEKIAFLNKCIDKAHSTMEVVSKIQHTDLLRALYDDILGRISATLLNGSSIALSEKLKYWDTEKGYIEYKKKQQEFAKMVEKVEKQVEKRNKIDA